jgi:endogenous inhibitor of DNA gyrase (YacG/DUF329 family)
MARINSRAEDPGIRLYQLAAVKWVHCPRCDGPAREAGHRLVCSRCSHVEGGPPANPRRLRRVMLAKNRPVCEQKSCGAPIPNHGTPVRGGGDGELHAKVKCPTCGHVGSYAAVAVTPSDVVRARGFAGLFQRWPPRRLYLSRRIGGHMLVVYNLPHLDALEIWLGARLRERGSVAGLTMMARLPRWMKSASARPLVMKALAELREQALREGLS